MIEEFTEEQKRYLEGFTAGSMLVAGAGVPTFASALGLAATGTSAPANAVPAGPEAMHFQAQDRIVAAGGKLCPEEVAKRKRFPLDVWDDIARHAKENVPPKGTDVLAFKYHGLFWVAPAQEAFMSRLRFPGGIVPSYQMRGVAGLAERFGGGYADVTTRANLQIREIKPADSVNLVEGLHELGIIHRGSGADNIRNVTGSPTAGVDPQELIDTRPLTRELHHYILNHREMYGLPRKFNVAYDGGGSISALEDTNDIGFTAVRVGEGKSVPAGIYFRLTLGGITGHKDFARDTGILLTPSECLPAAAAIIRVFIDHGDRTDRKKARLKYLLDKWGFEKFIAETDRLLPAPMRRFPLEECEPRPAVEKHGHIGVFAQKQPGLSYLGVALPVARLTCNQMRGLADISEKYGSRTLRLTVWQNLLISDIPDVQIEAALAEIAELDLSCSANSVRAGLVACTGAAGCKYALAHTKQHAMQVAEYLDERIELDQPVNIHLTGCPHSCAQHYIGDLGCLGTKVAVGEGDDPDMIDGYHLFVGGGYGATQGIARELYRNVIADELPQTIERMLQGYLEHRACESESFLDFVKRHDTPELKDLFEKRLVTR
ncbi:MAG TPA: NirA family protein [Tepidisphaeraceae bacterium]|nr:NirA family protein [Tepidisphaeraceae bacterium]